jgi:5'-AMP-activated protein kinase catalytic alpha subunit
MGFNKDHVCESLCSRLQNEVWACNVSLMFLLVSWILILQNFQATVAYYLLLDNRFKATSGYLGADYQESMVSTYLLGYIWDC